MPVEPAFVSNHDRAIARGGLAVLIVLLPFLFGADATGPAAPAVSFFDGLPRHWRDDDGRDLLLTDLRGRRVIMTMAYASCRKICPVAILRLQEMQQELDRRGEHAEFVIVGYDPVSDNPAVWRQYRATRQLTRLNWHFLTGSSGDTERLAQSLGLPFWKYDEHVMHDFRIVVFDANGAVHASVDSSRSDWKRAL